jgi:two-component system response regulator HydG
MLMSYHWPGNVRELQHLIERLVVLGRTVEISAADLPASVTAQTSEPVLIFDGPILPVKKLHRLYAQWAMAQLAGQRRITAERLGIDVRTLYNWLSEDSQSS